MMPLIALARRSWFDCCPPQQARLIVFLSFAKFGSVEKSSLGAQCSAISQVSSAQEAFYASNKI